MSNVKGNADEPIVFVNEADKKVFTLEKSDAEKVKSFLGHRVVLMGSAQGQKIDVATIHPMGAKPPKKK